MHVFSSHIVKTGYSPKVITSIYAQRQCRNGEKVVAVEPHILLCLQSLAADTNFYFYRNIVFPHLINLVCNEILDIAEKNVS